MVSKKTIKIGVLLLVILTSIFYITFESVRIDFEKTRTVFKVNQDNSWDISAREYVRVFDGSTLMRASNRENTFEYDYYSTKVTKTATLFRDNITITQIYSFDNNVNNIENVPVNEEVCFTNAQGKIFEWLIQDISYDGETKDITSPFNFGKNMRINFQDGHYRAKVYQNKVSPDKIIVRYRIENNNQCFNVKLFDPLPRNNIFSQNSVKFQKETIKNKDFNIKVINGILYHGWNQNQTYVGLKPFFEYNGNKYTIQQAKQLVPTLDLGFMMYSNTKWGANITGLPNAVLNNGFKTCFEVVSYSQDIDVSNFRREGKKTYFTQTEYIDWTDYLYGNQAEIVNRTYACFINATIFDPTFATDTINQSLGYYNNTYSVINTIGTSIAYYNNSMRVYCDETSGSNCEDSASDNNDNGLSLVGATLNANGDGAVLDGINDYLSFGGHTLTGFCPTSGSPTATFCMGVNFTSFNTVQQFSRIVCGGTILGISIDTSKIITIEWFGAAGKNYDVSSINENEYHFYCFDYNHATTIQSLYLDGSLVSSNSASSSGSGTGAFGFIGQQDGNKYINGTINNIMMWTDYSLTNQEILTTYNAISQYQNNRNGNFDFNGTYSTEVFSTNTTGTTPNLKINITTNVSCNGLSCPGLEILYSLDKEQTEDTDSGSFNDTITASCENCGSECKEDAFDKDISTKWLCFNLGTGQNITYIFTSPKYITQYNITSGNDEERRDPKNWTVYASNDGSNWVLIDNKTTNQPDGRWYTLYSPTDRGKDINFNIDNPGNYTYYSFYITSVSDPATNLIQLAEIKLFYDMKITQSQTTTDGVSTQIFNLTDTTNFFQVKYSMFGDSSNTNIINSIDYLVHNESSGGTPTPALACGDTITSDTTLTEDLTCSGNGLLLGASDVILDCNGYTITGNGQNVGILFSNGYPRYTNIQVKNCIVNNFNKNYQFGNINNVTFTNSKSYNSANESIYFGANANSTIRNITVINTTESSSFSHAIYLDSLYAGKSQNNIIENCHFENILAKGIHINNAGTDNVYNATIRNNYFLNINNQGLGDGACINCNYYNNTFENMGSYAYSVWVYNVLYTANNTYFYNNTFINVTNDYYFDNEYIGNINIENNTYDSDVSIKYNNNNSFNFYENTPYNIVVEEFFGSNVKATFNSTTLKIFNKTGNNTIIPYCGTNFASYYLQDNEEWVFNGCSADCTFPVDGAVYITDTLLCKGTYYINDTGSTGIFNINNNEIIIDGNYASFYGKNSGSICTDSSKNNYTIKNFNFYNYSKFMTNFGEDWNIDNNNITNFNGIIFLLGKKGTFSNNNFLSSSTEKLIFSNNPLASGTIFENNTFKQDLEHFVGVTNSYIEAPIPSNFIFNNNDFYYRKIISVGNGTIFKNNRIYNGDENMVVDSIITTGANKHNWLIKNNTFEGGYNSILICYKNSINGLECGNFTIIDNKFFNTSKIEFVNTHNTNGLLIENNTFDLSDTAISLQYNVINSLIRNNFINNTYTNIDTWGTPIRIEYNVSNITVEYNTIRNSMGAGILLRQSQNININNNDIDQLNINDRNTVGKVMPEPAYGSGIAIVELYLGFTGDSTEDVSDSYAKIHSYRSNDINIYNNTFGSNLQLYLVSQGTQNLTHDLTNYYKRTINFNTNQIDNFEYYIFNSIDNVQCEWSNYPNRPGKTITNYCGYSYPWTTSIDFTQFPPIPTKQIKFNLGKYLTFINNVNDTESYAITSLLDYTPNAIYNDTSGLPLFTNFIGTFNQTLAPGQEVNITNSSACLCGREGNCIIDCSDNCDITNNFGNNINTINFYNSGLIRITGELNYETIAINNGCTITR